MNKEERHMENSKLGEYLSRLTDGIDGETKSADWLSAAQGSDNANEMWSEEVKAFADMQTIESLFFSEDWVFIVLDLIASKISSQPLNVMTLTPTDLGKDSLEVNTNHPLNALIENPNKFQDYHSWMYNYVSQYFLLGNAINWYSSSTNQIVTLRTSLVSIDFSTKGDVESYLLMQPKEDNPVLVTKNSVMRFNPKEIIHTRRPNPASLIWGLSPFVPGRKSILFNRYSSDYLNSFYLKQATPGMIIEMDRQVNEQQALRQLRSFELAYTGRRNQRRTMILPKGTKATPSSHTIADQRIVDLVNMNRESLLALLKVPKHEVGLQTGGSLGSEEYKTALKNFWEATLIPGMRMIEGSLNSFFANQLGPSSFFKFDLSDVSSLQEDQSSKADMAAKMLASGKTVNEVRSMVWNLDPVQDPSADLPYMLLQHRFNSSLGSFSLRERQEPKLEEPKEDEPLALPLDNQTDKLKKFLKLKKDGWLENFTKSMEEIVEEREGKRLEKMALTMLTTFGEVASPVVKRNLIDTKSDIPSRRRLRRELQSAFNEFEEIWTDEYKSILRSVVETGYSNEIEFVFNVEDRAKIEALRARSSGARSATLEARGIDSFADISSTQTESIMKEILEGVEQNETIQQIITRVANKFTDPEKSLARAATIARTETLTAASIGQGGAIQNAMEVIPGLKKAWLNANDERVRDMHQDVSVGGVSGEVVDADKEFSNGLRWPRDVNSGDPSQVINCRCTTIMLLPGEELDI